MIMDERSEAVEEDIITVKHEHPASGPLNEEEKPPEPPHQSPKPASNHFIGLRSNVEAKSSQLHCVWSELSELLGQYKSDLFSVELAGQALTSMDSDQLKQEIVNRDNLIYERDQELAELRAQLEQVQQHVEELQTHSEQCRLEMDTKDRLLSQYQQDLMDKDAQLMTTNTKTTRLENKLKMLEARANVAISPQPSPRRAMRSPMGGMRGRGAAGRLVHAGVGRFSPGMTRGGGGPGLRRRFDIPQSRSPRQRPAPQPSTPLHSSQPPAVQTPRDPPQSDPQQIVCIELDDDEDSKTDIKPEGSSDGPATIQDALSIDMADFKQIEQMDINQALLAGGDYTTQDVWQPEDSASLSAHQGALGGDANKLLPHKCPQCSRGFSRRNNMARHLKVVHMNIKPFACMACERRFGQRQELDAHYRWHRAQTGSRVGATC